MSAIKNKAVSWRYVLAKSAEAGFESLVQFGLSRGTAAKQQSTFSDAMKAARATFDTVYSQPSTMVMYIAGTAMAPALNKQALKNADEIEKLVVRRMPRPSARNILIGDVVAFSSPLALAQSKTAAQSVMVRRVAAVGGTEMVGDGDESFVIQDDHFWAIGDNEAMSPPSMVDSRTFGSIPMRNIIGRVIYAANSALDHSAVTNHPHSMQSDAAIIEHEVSKTSRNTPGLSSHDFYSVLMPSPLCTFHTQHCLHAYKWAVCRS